MKKTVYVVSLDVTKFAKALRKFIKADAKDKEKIILNILNEHLTNYIKLYNMHAKIIKAKLKVN